MADLRRRRLERLQAAEGLDLRGWVRLLAMTLRESSYGDDLWVVRLRNRRPKHGRTSPFRHHGHCLPEWILRRSPWEGSMWALLPVWVNERVSMRYDEDLTFRDLDELLEFLQGNALEWEDPGSFWERRRRIGEICRQAREQAEADEQREEEAREAMRAHRARLRSIRGRIKRARQSRRRWCGKRLAALNACTRWAEETAARPSWPSDRIRTNELHQVWEEAHAKVEEVGARIQGLQEELTEAEGQAPQ